MNKPDGIFESPYRMQVINALKKATGTVFDKYLPQKIESALEVGCGDGFFYKYIVPKRLRPFLVGIDEHEPSLEIFRLSSPDARMQLGDLATLPFEDDSVDLIVGFSAYPLLTKFGVIEKLSQVLRPGGRVIAFHDSPIISPWEDDTDYDKMKRVETTHQLLKQKFSRNGWDFIDGFDPIESVVISSQTSVEQRLAEDMLRMKTPGKIIVATTNDLGISKVFLSDYDLAINKWNKVKEELGNPRILQNVEFEFGKDALEYVRMRYLVAEKKRKEN